MAYIVKTVHYLRYITIIVLHAPDYCLRRTYVDQVTHLLIHLSAHLYYHHHSRHPSLLNSFTPGSKPTFSTNFSHLRLLLPAFMTTGLERTYHAHRFIFSFTF